MKLNHIFPLVIFGGALVASTQFMKAVTCNGMKPCGDSSVYNPDPCQPVAAPCSGTYYSIDPCYDCATGGADDLCIVSSQQTGYVQSFSGGLCDGGNPGNCLNATFGLKNPITCCTLMTGPCTPP